jgi:hypothetical protein
VRASPDRGRRAVASCSAAVCCAVILVGTTACAAAHPGPSAPATPSANPLAGLTAGQITRKAIADLAAVSSVRIAGSAGQGGQTGFFEMTVGARGCSETFRIPGEGSSTLLEIGTTVWLKSDRLMLRMFWADVPAATQRRLEGKYLRMPDVPGGPMADCRPGQLASAFGAELKDLVTAKVTTISGQPALQLADKHHSTTAYVTISARPEILRIDVSGQEHEVFTGYNQPVTFTPPPANDTVTLPG